MLKALGYITKRVVGRKKGLRSERGFDISYIEESSLYRERKKKDHKGWKDKDKNKIKGFDSGCSLGPIDKSKTSKFFLLQRIWTREIWI